MNIPKPDCEADENAAFRMGVDYCAQALAERLLELVTISSEDMFRELVSISEGKSVTANWHE